MPIFTPLLPSSSSKLGPLAYLINYGRSFPNVGDFDGHVLSRIGTDSVVLSIKDFASFDLGSLGKKFSLSIVLHKTCF